MNRRFHVAGSVPHCYRAFTFHRRRINLKLLIRQASDHRQDVSLRRMRCQRCSVSVSRHLFPCGGFLPFHVSPRPLTLDCFSSFRPHLPPKPRCFPTSPSHELEIVSSCTLVLQAANPLVLSLMMTCLARVGGVDSHASLCSCHTEWLRLVLRRRFSTI